MSTPQYIIINWHWGPEVRNIPRVRKAEDISQKLQTLRRLKVKDAEEAFHESLTVIPIDIQIGPRESTKETKGKIISQMLTTLFKNDAKEKGAECQFFLHRGDGMDELQDFWELNLDQWEGLPVKYHAFGGGVGHLYDKDEGLLDSGVSNFKMEDEKEGIEAAADFEDDDPTYIYQDNFEKTWNYYWLLTHNKLRDLQKELMLACIPESPDLAILAAQNRVESLLYMNAKLQKDEFMEEHYQDQKIQEKEWDFFNCEDLLEKLHKIDQAKDKDLSLIDWISALEKFVVKGNNTDKTTLGQIFKGFQYLFRASI